MSRRATVYVSSEHETSRFAQTIAPRLVAGDTLLLSGDLGSGKTHFARALIQMRTGAGEHVPSPTFTLVQTYDTPDVQLWHADLYRLSDADEILELGLDDAFDTEICLIEWPDRLQDMAPATALALSFQFSEHPDHRQIDLTWSDPKWETRLHGFV